MKIYQFLLVLVISTSIYPFHFGIKDLSEEPPLTKQTKTFRSHNLIDSVLSYTGIKKIFNPFTQTPKPHPLYYILKDDPSSSSSGGDQPKAQAWANTWTMPFTETLFLKNDYVANKSNPSTTTGVFYYDFPNGSMYIRRENCMGDRFANGVRYFDNKPCIHQVTQGGKKSKLSFTLFPPNNFFILHLTDFCY